MNFNIRNPFSLTSLTLYRAGEFPAASEIGSPDNRPVLTDVNTRRAYPAYHDKLLSSRQN